ncbi:MAG TPA: nuclear transport factor 2 family protein [Dehalococcoidales bacterium]|nr:nuclear transport factor 2 family protein [Dehalococcoidales bacterium]
MNDSVSTEDMLAIQQQVARYSYTFDSGDAEGWANVFTEDGLWEFYAAGATTPATKLEGREQLRDFCAQRLSERREGVTSYHHQSGLIFDELTADSASVRTMLVLTIQVPTEAPRLYMTGVYQDQWVKTPQGWRIKYRVLRP